MTKKQKSKLITGIEFALFLVVVLSGIFLQFHEPLFNFLTAIALFGITIYFNRQNFALFGPSLFFFMAYLTGLLPVAKLGLFFVIPLVIYLVIMALYKRLKEKSQFFVLGKPGRNTWILGIVTVIVSSAALYIWIQVTGPDLSDITAMMPKTGMGMLLLLGAIFAIGNSIVEESIYRGILYNSLKLFVDNRWIVILIQAAIFGLAHWQGFPRGVSGVALALIYGLLLGTIRHRSHGLLAPIIVHTAADFTIYLLLLGEIHKL